MPRKTGGTLDQQRDQIARKYLRGPRRQKVIVAEAELADVERLVKQEVCCHLSAGGFAYPYIADALGVHVQTIKNWFGNPELKMAERVGSIQADYVQGAVKLMKTYLLEIVEEMMEIFRTSSDENAIKIGFEMMDRLGIAKVNKSESVSAATIREEKAIEVTDKTGLIASVKNAPPEVQARMAERLEDVLALAREHGETADA